jgi:hypothetical protein
MNDLMTNQNEILSKLPAWDAIKEKGLVLPNQESVTIASDKENEDRNRITTHFR